MTSDVNKQAVQVLGEEWSDTSSFQDVLKEMILPYCNNGNVLEIGIGGGRVALSTI